MTGQIASLAIGFPPATVGLFVAVFVAALGVDLLLHRRGEDVSVGNAAAWSAAWVALSLGFYAWLRHHHGAEAADLFLTGYVLEKTLSVDNLMVFLVVFRYFGLRTGVQHRVLHYGILGAVVFRAVFVALGSGALLAIGPWAELAFGALVAWGAVKMLREGGDDDDEGEPDYDGMPLVRVFRRFFPVLPHLVGSKFFVGRAEAEAAMAAAASPSTTEAAEGDAAANRAALEPGVTRWMTPAFVCLLVIEGSDVMFSVDSVPAVIAVTREPFLIYAAMIFAVLGLRSLYFLLAALTRYLVHLEKAVIGVLFFIAAKMFYGAVPHLVGWRPPFVVTPGASLAVVMVLLTSGLVASVVFPEKPTHGG